MRGTVLLALVAADQTIPPKWSGKEDPGEYPRPSSVGKMPESTDRTGIPTDCGTPGRFGTDYNGRKDCGDCAEAGSTGNSVWAKHWLRANNVFRCMHGVPPVKWDPILECWMDKWINIGLDDVLQKWGGPHSNAGTLPRKGAEGLGHVRGSEGVLQANMPNEVVKGLYYGEWKDGGQFEVGSWPGSSGKITGHFANIIWKGITHIGCARAHVGWAGCMGHNSGNPDARPNGENSINWQENYQAKVVKPFGECEKEVNGDGADGTDGGSGPPSSSTATSVPSSTTPPRSPLPPPPSSSTATSVPSSTTPPRSPLPPPPSSPTATSVTSSTTPPRSPLPPPPSSSTATSVPSSTTPPRSPLPPPPSSPTATSVPSSTTPYILGIIAGVALLVAVVAFWYRKQSQERNETPEKHKKLRQRPTKNPQE